MVNSELLRKVADKIEAEPENYIQAHWTCGTAHCIGGWAFTLDNTPTTLWEKMGLTFEECAHLCKSSWKPRHGLTVPEALRLIADGKSVAEVSHG